MGVGGGGGGVGWKHFLAVTLCNFQRKGAKFPQLLPLGRPCKTKMILFLTTEKQSGWNKKIHEARPCAKTRVAFCASEYKYFFAGHVQWTCKPSDLKGLLSFCYRRIGNKLANETTTSCQLVQNFLVCAVETYFSRRKANLLLYLSLLFLERTLNIMLEISLSADGDRGTPTWSWVDLT